MYSSPLAAVKMHFITVGLHTISREFHSWYPVPVMDEET